MHSGRHPDALMESVHDSPKVNVRVPFPLAKYANNFSFRSQPLPI
jgi:hypothetical protein